MKVYFAKLKKVISKLTIFDWLAILGIVAAIAFLGFNIFREEKWVRVEVRLEPDWRWESQLPPYWLADSIKVDDEEVNNRGEAIAKIEDLKIYERGSDKKDVYFLARLRVVVGGRDKKMKYKNIPLEVGAPIELHLNNTFVRGLVIYVEGLPDKSNWIEKEVEVKAMGKHPWEADAIQVGGQMRDGRGRVVAEVLEKKVELAKEVTMTTKYGESVAIIMTNPLRRDLTLKVKLLMSEQSGSWYFLKNQKIKVGGDIIISLSEIDISGNISRIFN